MLVGVRGMGERAGEQVAVGEPVSERALERAQARVGDLRRCQAGYLRNASVAFVPPKPKAFDSATSTSCLRAWFGT
jgi:hypothetical protein